MLTLAALGNDDKFAREQQSMLQAQDTAIKAMRREK